MQKKYSNILYNQITLALAIASFVGVMFGIRNYFSNPTDELKIQSAVFEERMNEVTLRVQNLKDNDLHSLGLKVNEIDINVEALRNDITELRTILNERLPAKK